MTVSFGSKTEIRLRKADKEVVSDYIVVIGSEMGLIGKASENQTIILNLLLQNNSADNKKLIEEYERKV